MTSDTAFLLEAMDVSMKAVGGREWERILVDTIRLDTELASLARSPRLIQTKQ